MSVVYCLQFSLCYSFSLVGVGGRRIDRQTDRERENSNSKTLLLKNSSVRSTEADRQTDRQAGRQADKNRETESQTDRDTERERNRQTDGDRYGRKR